MAEPAAAADAAKKAALIGEFGKVFKVAVHPAVSLTAEGDTSTRSLGAIRNTLHI